MVLELYMDVFLSLFFFLSLSLSFFVLEVEANRFGKCMGIWSAFCLAMTARDINCRIVSEDFRFQKPLALCLAAWAIFVCS